MGDALVGLIMGLTAFILFQEGAIGENQWFAMSNIYTKISLITVSLGAVWSLYAGRRQAIVDAEQSTYAEQLLPNNITDNSVITSQQKYQLASENTSSTEFSFFTACVPCASPQENAGGKSAPTI